MFSSNQGSKSRDTTANKGSATSQANTKERCTVSSESRKEAEEGCRHADAASSRTEDSKTSRSHQTSTSAGFRDVPFMKRGRFFDDSFFESSRFDFDKKVNEILARLGEEERLDRWDDDTDFRLNNFKRYRNLRARDLRDDNQAITVTSDDTTHKVIRLCIIVFPFRVREAFSSEIIENIIVRALMAYGCA